jgi:uncharacterized protein
MKILYTSDLHGERQLYQELLSLAASSSVEIIALGGDLLPSFSPTKRYEDMVPYQKAFIGQFLLPFLKNVIETTNVRNIFTIPGNWDLGYFFLFQEQTEGVIDLSQKIYSLKSGHEIIGYPFVPPTPFRPKEYERMDDREAPWPPQKKPSYILSPDPPDELTSVDPYLYLKQRRTIQEDLARLPRPHSPKSAIYIMHSPPFGTPLDLIHGGKPAGSRSITAFIKQDQPLLTLHGHIHESPEVSGSYFTHIGETLSINPGQFTSSRLQGVVFELEDVEKTLVHTCWQG